MTLPIRYLLIADVETTGIEYEENAPIEIGAILFDVKHRAVTHQLSMLLPSHVPNGAEAINRIPETLVGEPATSAVRELHQPALDLLDLMVSRADAMLAHNADFDRQWIHPLIGEVMRDERPIPWLCTLRDFRWNLPGLRATPSVIDLALAHCEGGSGICLLLGTNCPNTWKHLRRGCCRSVQRSSAVSRGV